MTAHSCTEFWCLLGSRSAGNVFNVARRHRASGFNHEASRRPNSMSGVLLFFLYSFVHGKIKGILRLKTFFRTPPHAGASVAGDERRRARRAASGEDRDQLKSSEYGKSFDLTVSGPFRSKVLESPADVAGRDFGPTTFRNGNDSETKEFRSPEKLPSQEPRSLPVCRKSDWNSSGHHRTSGFCELGFRAPQDLATVVRNQGASVGSR